MSLAAATALADDVPTIENPYALKKKVKAALGPEVPIDPGLAAAVGTKISECYQEEQKADLSEDDRKLLDEYGPEVVRDLAASIKYTSCQLDKPASPRCLQDVSALDCATLAEPIVAAGWDRNLTPEAKAQVRAYAKVLGDRLNACEGRSGEEAAIVGGTRIDQLSVLIESEIVIGRCQLQPEKQLDCNEQVKEASCEEFQRVHNRGEITQFCSDSYTCGTVPVAEPEQ